jgi:hypothetical protein
VLRIMSRRSEPQRDCGDTHDHVPAHHDRVVDMTASSMERKNGGIPRAITSTPIISINVATRNNTSSLSYAEASHE